jgi:hypothetical protein
MTNEKYIGIWMDHSIAYVMGFTRMPAEISTIKSKFTHEERELSMSNGESRMHAKEQHFQAGYYKEISDVIINCEEVLLFGPTDAKVELYNLLKENHHFDKIKIVVKQTDKMTANQQQAFVKDHFLKQ